MATLLLDRIETRVPLPLPETDEAAARRTLREQIARLEAELAAQSPRPPLGLTRPRRPRLLSLAELEQVRDRLADDLASARAADEERGVAEEAARRLREEMLLEPGRYAFVRVSNEAVGEPGCCDWHVRPRFGLLGILMRWWRVVVSSGCP